MGSSAGDNNPAERFTAAQTRFSSRGAPVDGEMMLIFSSTAVRVPVRIERCAPITDTIFEHRLNGVSQRADILNIEGPCGSFRMDTSAEKCFVDVDVAESGDDCLIEQERFNWSRAIAKSLLKTFDGKLFAERFGAKFRIERSNIIWSGCDNAAEFALIGVSKIDRAI